MSWNAKRYKSRTNGHHIPPLNPAHSTPFIKRVKKTQHNAYHALFQNAASFEQCVEILWKQWWLPYYIATGIKKPDILEVSKREIERSLYAA